MKRGNLQKCFSILITTAFRFTAAISLLTLTAAIFGNSKFLPPPTVLNSAILSALGVPGFALLSTMGFFA